MLTEKPWSEKPQSAPAPDAEVVEPGDTWRPRPNRLIIGVVLIALALVWSTLNGGLGATRGPGRAAQVMHGPVLTRVETIGGVRVRPEVAPGATEVRPANVNISFHNAGSVARLITAADVRLVVGGRSLLPARAGHDALRRAALMPGRYVTDVLHFDAAPAPGATLVFLPSWSHGHALRWVLWR